MEKVTGIGGMFFRAKDPAALAEWYEKNLGVAQVPSDYETTPWKTEAGTTVFAPFKHDTGYFGDAEKQWMINFRVRNMDAMVAELRAGGVEVEVADTAEENGRFARLYDPEGNPIELWEPSGADPH